MSKEHPVEPAAALMPALVQGPEVGQPCADQHWEAASKLIHSASNLLLICHVSPDGDAIGSLLGLGLALKALGKETTLACESPPPAKFNFLPGFENIVDTVEGIPFDLVIGLDSSDPARLGSVYQPLRLAGAPLLNIDHHVTNLYYGDVNIVDTQAASTAEIIVTLLEHLEVALEETQTPGVATSLLTGIVTDTLGFRTSNVTPRVMAAAMRLMEAGASLSRVTYYAFNQRPLVELRLLAIGLSRIEVDDGLAWSEIRLADQQACGHMNGDVGLVGMLARTQEVQIAAVFTEKQDNKVEIGFRADPGFDVSQIALSLGGGGHPAASGCTISGSPQAAKERVLPMLRAALSAQRRAQKSHAPHPAGRNNSE
jgi:phosphoesterase RecJ-like protein